MKCDVFRERVDEFVRGELPADGSTAAERHASACLDCAGRLDRARRALGLVESLPRWVEPPSDLWPGIEAGLDADRRVVRGSFGRSLRTWLAAAAVVAAAASAVLVAFTVGRQQARVVEVEAQRTPAAVPARLGDGSITAVEAEFREARSELLAALEQREGRLSPEAVETVYRNLRVIDDAIDRISQALGEDPGNPMLAGQLTRAYQQQIQLLRRASQLPAEI